MKILNVILLMKHEKCINVCNEIINIVHVHLEIPYNRS